MIGDSSVGKTSLLNRLANNTFMSDLQPTIATTFTSYRDVVDEEPIEIQLWDTAGQERFRALAPIYFRSASAAIAVFDVTSQESFDHLPDWIAPFHAVVGPSAVVAVVGNKADREDRAVSDSTAFTWCEAKQYPYFAMSARTGAGVRPFFHDLAVLLAHASIGQSAPALRMREDRCGCS
jgi:small GTP-binding protein